MSTSMKQNTSSGKKWLREASMQRLSLLVKNKTELIGNAAQLGLGVSSTDNLERSGLSAAEIYHLEQWVLGLQSGRFCMLAFTNSRLNNTESDRASFSAPVKNEKFEPIDFIRTSMNLPENFLCDSGYLYETVFGRPPVSVICEALQMVTGKTFEKSPAALGVEQINMAIKQLRLENVGAEDVKAGETASEEASPGDTENATAKAENENAGILDRRRRAADRAYRLQIMVELIRLHVISGSSSGSSYSNTGTPLRANTPISTTHSNDGSPIGTGTESIPSVLSLSPLLYPPPSDLSGPSQRTRVSASATTATQKLPRHLDTIEIETHLRTPLPDVQKVAESMSAEQLESVNVLLKPYLKQLAGLKAALSVQLKDLQESRAFIALGVTSSASDEEIKKAYRLMAIRLHPDKPGGDTAKFQQLQASYQEVLKKRKGDKNKLDAMNAAEDRRKARFAKFERNGGVGGSFGATSGSEHDGTHRFGSGVRSSKDGGEFSRSGSSAAAAAAGCNGSSQLPSSPNTGKDNSSGAEEDWNDDDDFDTFVRKCAGIDINELMKDKKSATADRCEPLSAKASRKAKEHEWDRSSSDSDSDSDDIEEEGNEGDDSDSDDRSGRGSSSSSSSNASSSPGGDTGDEQTADRRHRRQVKAQEKEFVRQEAAADKKQKRFERYSQQKANGNSSSYLYESSSDDDGGEEEEEGEEEDDSRYSEDEFASKSSHRKIPEYHSANYDDDDDEGDATKNCAGKFGSGSQKREEGDDFESNADFQYGKYFARQTERNPPTGSSSSYGGNSGTTRGTAATRQQQQSGGGGLRTYTDDEDHARAIGEHIDNLLGKIRVSAGVCTRLAQLNIKWSKRVEAAAAGSRFPHALVDVLNVVCPSVSTSARTTGKQSKQHQQAFMFNMEACSLTNAVEPVETICDLAQQIASLAMEIPSGCGILYGSAAACHPQYLASVEHAMQLSLGALKTVVNLITAQEQWDSCVRRVQASASAAVKDNNADIHDLLVEMLRTALKSNVVTVSAAVDRVVEAALSAAEVGSAVQSLLLEVDAAQREEQRRQAEMQEAEDAENDYCEEDKEMLRKQKQERFEEHMRQQAANATGAKGGVGADRKDKSCDTDEKDEKDSGTGATDVAAGSEEMSPEMKNLNDLRGKIRQLQVALKVQHVTALQSLNSETVNLQASLLKELNEIPSLSSIPSFFASSAAPSSSGTKASSAPPNQRAASAHGAVQRDRKSSALSLLADVIDAACLALRSDLQAQIHAAVSREQAEPPTPLTPYSEVEASSSLPSTPGIPAASSSVVPPAPAPVLRDKATILRVFSRHFNWIKIALSDGSADLMPTLQEIVLARCITSMAKTESSSDENKIEIEKTLPTSASAIALLPDFRSKSLVVAALADVNATRSLILNELPARLEDIVNECFTVIESNGYKRPSSTAHVDKSLNGESIAVTPNSTTTPTPPTPVVPHALSSQNNSQCTDRDLKSTSIPPIAASQSAMASSTSGNAQSNTLPASSSSPNGKFSALYEEYSIDEDMASCEFDDVDMDTKENFANSAPAHYQSITRQSPCKEQTTETTSSQLGEETIDDTHREANTPSKSADGSPFDYASCDSEIFSETPIHRAPHSSAAASAAGGSGGRSVIGGDYIVQPPPIPPRTTLGTDNVCEDFTTLLPPPQPPS